MNYELRRGDSMVADITLEDDLGAPLPRNGVTVIITAKQSVDDTDGEALFQHRVAFDENGSVIIATQESIYLVGEDLVHRIDPDESATFAPGTYQYDIQVRYPSSVVAGEFDVDTKITGTITVVADITQAVS